MRREKTLYYSSVRLGKEQSLKWYRK